MTEVEVMQLNAKVGDRVRYVPLHADGDIYHPDCEDGRISSFGELTVYVKFNKSVGRHGWDGASAIACDPEDLRKL
jgi:hypothetical protein